MINKVTIFNNITTKTKKIFCRIKSYNPLQIKQLDKDLFEKSESSAQKLAFNPPIINGSFDSGIKDTRFASFETEFRAYDYEGYDNKFPSEYICIDSNGERRLKPHIHIKYAEVKPEFARQSAYKNAIKQLVELAGFDKECEGRISLDARKIESPDMTRIPSPSIAHWKCGFRFANKENNTIMERILKGELPPEDAPEGSMYYALS